jgi:hypothetical protein
MSYLLAGYINLVKVFILVIVVSKDFLISSMETYYRIVCHVFNELNGTHQLLLFAAGDDTMGENINTINNTKALLEVSSEVGLEVNTEKIKYMVMSYYQNAGQNCNLLVDIKSFENVAKFNILEEQLQIKIALVKKLRAD